MKAIFGRKMADLEELRQETKRIKLEGRKETEYFVTKEIKLSDSEFSNFCKDFYKEQDWIGEKEGGSDKDGKIRCIRVINTKTKERILVNPEGYTYPRYTAIEQ